MEKFNNLFNFSGAEGEPTIWMSIDGMAIAALLSLYNSKRISNHIYR